MVFCSIKSGDHGRCASCPVRSAQDVSQSSIGKPVLRQPLVSVDAGMPTSSNYNPFISSNKQQVTSNYLCRDVRAYTREITELHQDAFAFFDTEFAILSENLEHANSQSDFVALLPDIDSALENLRLIIHDLEGETSSDCLAEQELSDAQVLIRTLTGAYFDLVIAKQKASLMYGADIDGITEVAANPLLLREFDYQRSLEEVFIYETELQNLFPSKHRAIYIRALSHMKKGDVLAVRGLFRDYFSAELSIESLSDQRYLEIFRDMQTKTEQAAMSQMIAYSRALSSSIERKPDSTLDIRKLDMQKIAGQRHTFSIQTVTRLIKALVDRGYSIEEALGIIKKEFPVLKKDEFYPYPVRREIMQHAQIGYPLHQIKSILEKKGVPFIEKRDKKGEPFFEAQGLEVYTEKHLKPFLDRYGLNKKSETNHDAIVITAEDLGQGTPYDKDHTGVMGVTDFVLGRIPESMNIWRENFVASVLSSDERARKGAILGLISESEAGTNDNGLYALSQSLYEQYFSREIYAKQLEIPMLTEDDLAEEMPNYMEFASVQAEKMVGMMQQGSREDVEPVKRAIIENMITEMWHRRVLKAIHADVIKFNPNQKASQVRAAGFGPTRLPGQKQNLPSGMSVEEYLSRYEAVDAKVWKAFNDEHLEIDRSWLSFAMTEEEFDRELPLLALDVLGIFLTALVAGAIKAGASKCLMRKWIIKYGLQKAFIKEAGEVFLKRGIILISDDIITEGGLKKIIRELTLKEMYRVSGRAMGGQLAKRLLVSSSTRLAGAALHIPLFYAGVNLWHEHILEKEVDWNVQSFARTAIALTALHGVSEAFGSLPFWQQGVLGFTKETIGGFAGFHLFALGSFYYDMERVPKAEEHGMIFRQSAMWAGAMALPGGLIRAVKWARTRRAGNRISIIEPKKSVELIDGETRAAKQARQVFSTGVHRAMEDRRVGGDHGRLKGKPVVRETTYMDTEAFVALVRERGLVTNGAAAEQPGYAEKTQAVCVKQINPVYAPEFVDRQAWQEVGPNYSEGILGKVKDSGAWNIVLRQFYEVEPDNRFRLVVRAFITNVEGDRFEMGKKHIQLSQGKGVVFAGTIRFQAESGDGVLVLRNDSGTFGANLQYRDGQEFRVLILENLANIFGSNVRYEQFRSRALRFRSGEPVSRMSVIYDRF